LLAAPAVAKRDGDGALGLLLADDVRSSSETISRGEKSLLMGLMGECQSFSMTMLLPLV
jgi:hypothetical protein